jgi:uncharacterized protein (DUF952 family)
MLIFKIFRGDEYAAFASAGETAGAPLDVRDGYIHFSTAETVLDTARKYFSGVQGLKLLAVESDRLGDDLRWEPARGGVLFPHLYRVLTADDAVWARDMPALADGAHQFPE